MTEQYTHGHHESVLRAYARRTVENSAGYLLSELVPGRSVLDVGSGSGTITVGIAAQVAPGQVVGLDASADVVAQAASLAAERGVDNVRFVAGSAYELPFEDASFDVVHAHQVLQHLGDPVRALREMRRVVKPGGVVGVRDVDYALAGWYPASAELDAWLDLYHRVARANGGEPDAGRRLQAWTHEAGFTEVVTSASAWYYSSPETRAWWGGSWADRVIHSAFADGVLQHGLATREELERIRDGWLRWVDEPEGTFLMTHGEALARG